MKHCFLPAWVLLAAAPLASRAQATVSLGVRLGGNYATRSGSDPAYQPDSRFGLTSNVKADYTRSGLLAPQFGAVLDVRFGNLAVQPAVLFSQKGVDQQLTASSTTNSSSSSGFFSSRTTDKYHLVSRPNYLEIPVNIVYTSGGDHGFQVFGGPYVAFGVGGRAELEQESQTTGSGSSGSSNYYSYGNTFFYYRDDYPGPQPSPFSSFAQSATFEASSGALVARRLDAGLNAGVGYRAGPVQVQLGYGLGLLNQQPNKAPVFRDDLPAYYQRVVQLTATYFVKAK